jgi:hypothetical protein
MTTKTQDALITVGLVTVIGYAFFSVTNTFALGEVREPVTRTPGCTPYTHSMTLSHFAGILQHATCNVPAAKDRKSIPSTSVTITTQDVTLTVDIPATDDSQDEIPGTSITIDEPVVNPPANDPIIVEVPADDNLGNPGNLKDVGHAGENPNDKDTMPIDNAGGNGNGEHGNQGVNH